MPSAMKTAALHPFKLPPPGLVEQQLPRADASDARARSATQRPTRTPHNAPTSSAPEPHARLIACTAATPTPSRVA